MPMGDPSASRNPKEISPLLGQSVAIINSNPFKTKGRDSRATQPRSPALVGVLKPEAQHELQLPGQTRTGIGRSDVVVVAVEVHRRCDEAESRVRSQEPGGGGRGIIAKIQLVRIAKLGVVENVEGLKSKLYGESLVYLGVLHKCQVDLPCGECPDEAISGIAKPGKKAISVHRWSFEG